MSGRCPMAKIENISGKIIAYIRGKLIRKYGNDKPLRTFHAKTIGVVEGELKIRDDLPDSLKVGLFKQDKTYKVWIRFTNGSPTVSPDENKAARGMAIKVLDVKSSGYLDEDPEGNTQDIILFTSRIYAPGIPGPQLSGVKAALTKGLEQIFHAICVAVVTFKPAINFLKSVIISPNILEEMYYSGTPYSFGDRAIKWHAKPIKTITSVMPKNPGENFLSERLSKDYRRRLKKKLHLHCLYNFMKAKKPNPLMIQG